MPLPSPTAERSLLLSLPRELRNLIYEKYMWSIQRKTAPRLSFYDGPRPVLGYLDASSAINILLVNHQIKAEFEQELYRYACQVGPCVLAERHLGQPVVYRSRPPMRKEEHIRNYCLQIKISGSISDANATHRTLESSIPNLVSSKVRHLTVALLIDSSRDFTSLEDVLGAKFPVERFLRYHPEGLEQLRTFKKTITIVGRGIGMRSEFELYGGIDRLNARTGKLECVQTWSRDLNFWIVCEDNGFLFVYRAAAALLGSGWKAFMRTVPYSEQLNALHELWAAQGKPSRDQILDAGRKALCGLKA